MKRQENWKPKFLIDQNISYKTASFIKGLGFDVKTLGDAGLKGKSDTDIVSFAKREEMVIITFDKDFGEIYYFSEKGNITVIVLYLDDQTVENVNFIVGKFLSSANSNLIKNKLSIVYKDRVRLIV